MPGSLTRPFHNSGPLVHVRLSLPFALEAWLVQGGGRAPAPIDHQALLDTGTGMCVIADDFVRALSLPRRGRQRYRSTSTASQWRRANVYEVRLAIMNGQSVLHEWPNVPVMEASFSPADPYHVIIGRDLLDDDCILTYNGKSKTFTLDI